MLLPINVNPESTIYYQGSFVYNEIKRVKRAMLFDLYATVCKKHMMNFTVFLLCLDWLYLVDLATTNEHGEVICL